jgi:ubiquinone/menaquinone biosynthesis C-methylase UbiE
VQSSIPEAVPLIRRDLKSGGRLAARHGQRLTQTVDDGRRSRFKLTDLAIEGLRGMTGSQVPAPDGAVRPGGGGYALGSDVEERARLRRQSDELRPYAVAILDRVGIGPGQAAIDLGCGPSGILELLAERTLPEGRVVGLDIDPANVAMAGELARKRLAGVEVMQADAKHTGLRSGSFDLVHARTLLINIPEPEAVVAEMVRLARPGGWVAGQEPDAGLHLCYPHLPAWDRLNEIFQAAYRRQGADPFIGRRLTELYRNAGLVEVGVDVRAGVFPAGHSRRTIRLELIRSMRTKIMGFGLADQRELDELDRAAREHLSDPRTLLMSYLYFLAWGRKPADA